MRKKKLRFLQKGCVRLLIRKVQINMQKILKIDFNIFFLCHFPKDILMNPICFILKLNFVKKKSNKKIVVRR